MMTQSFESRSREAGSAMIVMIIMVVVFAGIATPVLLRSLKEHSGTSSDVMAARALFTAESGLDYNFLLMQKDPLYAVKAGESEYKWDAGRKHYEAATPKVLYSTGASHGASFGYGIQYQNSGTAVEFADRTAPAETFDTIVVRSWAVVGKTRRIVEAYYRFQFGHKGAIVSDMEPTSQQWSKNGAKDGNISIDSGGRNNQVAIFGDIVANGMVWYDNTQLTMANASTYLMAFSGQLKQELFGTPDEVPDFTSIGGNDQLFDFERMYWAASEGAGAIYTTIAEFETAVAAANAVSEPLEGIQFLSVDPGSEGGSPSFTVSGGINIRGTFVVAFAPGTAADYKIKALTDVNINGLDLSSVDFADEATYVSGYGQPYVTATPMPHQVNITSHGKDNFSAEDDLPAVMFNNGIIDYHHNTNICGVVYGPSFIEIENKNSGQLQYFNGAIFGEAGSTSKATAPMATA